MLARSVRNPLIIGVGTGLVLVSGTAPAALAATTPTPTPSPSASTTAPSNSPSATPTTSTSASQTPTSKPSTSDSATPTPSSTATTPTPPPPLQVKLERKSTGAIHAGSTVKFVAHVKAGAATMRSVQLGVIAKPAAELDLNCVLSDRGLCELGDVTTAVKDASFTLTVSAKTTSGTIQVSVYATSTPDNTDSTSTPYSLKVTKKPKPTPSPTHSNGSGGGGSGGTNLPTGNLGGTGSVPSATPSSSSAVLPPITTPQQQAPATAPEAQNPGDAPRMRGTAADANELTFGELASTQAAWLAALLVAFSLLLTQVRLGRANIKVAKQKGTHRRPRRPGNAH